MEQEISITQLKEKLADAQQAILHIIDELQQETRVKVTGLKLYNNQIEVARNEDLLLKIEYDL